MKSTFYSFLMIALVMSCSNEPKKEAVKLSAENPFNVTLNQAVDYANVTGAHIEEYVNVTIENAELEIDAIKALKNVSFANTYETYDKVFSELNKSSNNAFMLYWVSTDSITRAKGLEGYQKIEKFNTNVGSDKALFNKFKAFADSDEYSKLKGHKKRLVDFVMQTFERSGVNLNEADVETYKKLLADISDLSSQYSINMNTANEVLTLTEAQAEGLPENFKNKYKTETGYEIPVQNATRGPVMSNAKSSAVRKEFTTKYANRGADKNLTILDSLVSKRYQLGKLMGYDSYAAYNLAPKMAKDPATVWEFVNGLVAKSKEKAIQDYEVLKAVRNKELNTPNDDSRINAWDAAYYKDQILKNEYKVDNEKMREYLPMQECLAGMFELYQELLGLEFRKIEGASVWHEEVETYEVYEGDKLKGRFYLDLFPRPNKESWFYGVPLTYGLNTSEGYEVPVSMLLGNFTRPTEDLPSLLSHGELSTLFHEFGHIVDGMSYEGDYSMQAYSKADFAEAMSQIFENWIFDYDILSSFAKHYETGEVFPKDLYDNMMNAKNVSSGIGAQGSLRRCLYDMYLYDKFNPEKPFDTDQLWRDLDAQMGLGANYIEGTHTQGSWIHINTHPTYYYGYLWSEVFAQDMFTVFEENGLRDQATGVKYRKLILANGSQRDILEAVEEFLGRPSNNDAYIKSLGLK
ncbi:M3 family metallopeptidase [Pontimicrobium sp. IMCC45349]|uniref:M3 family metallopeptidase n=1 Tax=Pontimicrobium sp. IMCC45349 TaxID=3391574 RepID=UPI00399F8BA0